MIYKILISTLLILQVGISFMAYGTNSQLLCRIESEILADDSTNGKTVYGWPPDWEVPVNTGNFAYAKIESYANPRINNVPLENGDYIGAFYTDAQGVQHCAGAGEWNSVGILFGFFGDDPYTPIKDGFTYNEVIKFKFFDWSKNKAYDIPTTNVQYGTCTGCNTSGKFNGLGIHKVINIYMTYILDVVASATPYAHCLNGTTQLNAAVTGATGAVTYSWTSVPAGFTSNIANPVVNTEQSTTYKISVTNNANTSSHYAKVYTYGQPTVEAGNAGAICSNQTFTASGDGGTDYSSLFWTTSGDGTFNDPSVLHTVYTPGIIDRDSQTVKLYLSAFANNPCTGSVIDSTTITIIPIASVSAGEDFMVCFSEQVHLNATAIGYSSVLWTRSGGGTAGTFTNVTSLNATYTPSNYDLAAGYVNLIITVQPLSPCTAPASDLILVSFKRTPTSNAGSGATICASNNFNVSGTATYYSSVMWTSSGDGSFINPGALSTTYILGQVDKLGGNISLTLSANAIAPCVNPALGSLNLNIKPLPVPLAGNDTTICENTSFVVPGSAQNYSSFQWLTSGDGTFTNSTSLTPTYNPGNQDKINGSVTITLKAFSIIPCSGSVSDAMTLSFQKNPIVNAGVNKTTCGNQYINLSGSSDYSGSVLWTSSGDGNFDAPNNLNTQYFPGPGDNISGSVQITLTAFPLTPCMLTPSDIMNLTVVPIPTAFAGADNSYCGNNPVNFSGTSTNYSSITWNSSGDGIFSTNNSLITSYIPGAGDLNADSIFITLRSDPILPCSVPVLDSLVLTKIVTAQINAGVNSTICEGSSFQTTATASNYESLIWTSSGSGTFSNASFTNPTYTPSNDDIAAGSVTLTLSAYQHPPCSGIVSSSMILTIQKTPTSNAGTDLSVCNTGQVQLNGAALNYNSVIWSKSGTGTFSNSNLLNPVYTPSTADLNAGNVTLTLTANPISPCVAPAVDALVLNLVKSPTANAGINRSICQTGSLNIFGSSALNYSTLIWTTSGTGSFNNNTALHPIYTPSAADITSGQVTLTLTAHPNTPCSANASASMTLTIIKNPTALAGNNQTTCGTNAVQLNATATNYGSIMWTKSGTGSFSNNAILNPVYTPSAADVLAGNITLTITVQPLTPCTAPASSSLILTLVKPATISAGSNSSICQGNLFNTSATAQNYSTLIWSTSGTGTFGNANILNTTYTPSSADINSGAVTLTLSANQNAPCTGIVASSMILSIQKTPVIEAGSNLTSCATVPVQLSATASNSSTFLWSTSGTGTFSNSGILNPIYTPSQNDVTTGFQVLTITANPISPCTAPAIDDLTVTLKKLPISNAGDDNTYCGTNPISLSGTAQNHSSVLWETNGDGTFLSDISLITSYTPGTNDLNANSVTLTLTAYPIAPCTAPSQDQLVLTKVITAQINAGANSTICQGSNFQTSATASNYESLSWTSSGTGTFSNASITNPIYTPSNDDITAGSVTLTLSAYQYPPCSGIISSSMVLTIQKTPTSNAGTDLSGCNTGQVQLNGSALNYNSVSWSKSGTGTFSNPSLLNPVYTPSTADLNAGTVTLTLTANPISPCTAPAMDELLLTLVKSPTANAGTNRSICQTGIFNIDGSGALNYSSLLWTTSGTGTFNNNAILYPVYTPSTADITAGSVTLTLTAYPYAPCTANAVSSMTLTIVKIPTVVAGNNQTVCGTNTVQLNATATHYSSILWTKSGSGSFSNTTILNPVYTPSASDVNAGNITLTVTVQPSTPCTAPASSSLILTLVKPATVSVGGNSSICQGSVFNTSATAQNYSTLLWTTSGTGTFGNTSTLNTTYTPGTADINSGAVTLTLTASQNTPCTGTVGSSMILSIQKAPISNAGADLSICNTGQVQLNGSASFYSSILWTKSGTGTFSNPSLLNPVYTPSTTDLNAGNVTLTLTANPISPCIAPAVDALILNLVKSPTANAGTNRFICQTQTLTIATSSAANYSSLLWTTSGTGSFNNNTIVKPVYTPSAADIIAGSVTLTLTAQPNSPCTGAISDNMILTINHNPTVEAGQNQVICGTNQVNLTGTATSYNTVLWTTSGTGIFNNANIVNPVYTASTNDISNGVTLTLTANPLSPCTLIVSDQLNVSFQEGASVNAGGDYAICENEVFQIFDAVVTNEQSIDSFWWISDGDGIFSDSTLIDPVYTPGIIDISRGHVNLSLIVQQSAPCTGTLSDSKSLTITSNPLANAGNDTSTCNKTQIQLNGSATNFSSVSWTSSGSGSFSKASALDPVYYPTDDDLNEGSVNIILTVGAINPCSSPAIDNLVLSLIRSPEVFAGANRTICQTEILTIISSSVSYSSSLLWTTSGTGTFNDNSILNPEYTPSPEDIAAGLVTLTLEALPNVPCTTSVADAMTLTIIKNPEVTAGSNLEVCGTSQVELNASATNSTSALWTTSGTGNFSDNSILNPVYSPSSDDLESGSITLTVTVQPLTPCTSPATSSLILTLQKPATVFAGNDDTYCGTDAINLNGTAQNHAAVLWETSGDGVFLVNNSLITTYNPGTGDLIDNSVTLTLTAYPIAPCTAPSQDQLVFTKVITAQIYAGIDAAICQGSSFQTTATATNYESLEWTSYGTGTFSDATITNPVFTPSNDDILAGSVTLILSATQNPPCSGIVSSSMVLTIQKIPTSNAGDDLSVCDNGQVQLNGSALNHSSVEWSTSGSGSFSNPSLLNPVYTPSTADLDAGTVTLTFKANAIYPCSAPTADALTLSLTKSPVASAGANETICQTQTLTIASSSASNYSSLLWTSSGTGTFDNNAILNPVYIPGEADIVEGSVILTLTSFPMAPCVANKSGSMILSIQKIPTVEAGNDLTSCDINPVALVADTTHSSSLIWITTGTGFFNDHSISDPVYFPSNKDMDDGSVEITVIANPVNPCTAMVSDYLIITFQKLATADAGTDHAVCAGSIFTLNANVTDYSSLSWTTSGDGSFDNIEIPNPVYTPGNDDIANEAVTLTLLVDHITPCIGAISDEMILTINHNPTVDAGMDQTFCGVLPVQLNAVADDFSLVEWMTEGHGTFENPNSLNAVYNPGQGDISEGLIKILITAYPLTGCSTVAIDSLFLSLSNPAEVYAGDDISICPGSSAELNAQVNYANQYLWSTSGTGTFTDEHSPTSQYIPSNLDIFNGSVILTLTAESILPCMGNESDNLTLTIIPLPISNAGSDQYFCGTTPVNLEGTASNYRSVLWATSGNGTFSNVNILNPVYTPGTADVTAGFVNLILTVTAYSPCNITAVDAIRLSTSPSITVDAGPNATACQTVAFYQCNGSATNYSSLLWTSSDSEGTFDNPTIINPKYYPGTNHKLNGGSKILTLKAYKLSPCADSIQDAFTFTIRKSPVIAFGPDRTKCTADTVRLKATKTDNFSNPNSSSVNWTSSGTGTFTEKVYNSNFISAVYSPSNADFMTGYVTISVGINYTGFCPGLYSDQIIIYFPSDITLTSDVEDQGILMGENASFTVTAQANTNITYQWYGPQGVIQGAVSHQLMIENVAEADTGLYYCEMSNACHVIYSRHARLSVFISQTLQIPEGWSGISTFVKPVNPSVESMFGSLVNDLIILQNNSGIYWPGESINTIGNWSEYSGYQIKMDHTQNLEVIGARTTNKSITLLNGWNYLPVISSCPVNVSQFLAAHSQVVMVKQIAGTGIYWPSMGINTIGELIPGKAYMILTTGTLSLTFPACTAKSGYIDGDYTPAFISPWDSPEKTPANHIIGFTSDAMRSFEPGDVIGVFNHSGSCCGQTLFESSEVNCALTAFGNDQLSSGEAMFNTGDALMFKLYRPSSGEIFDLKVKFENGMVNEFNANGISVVTASDLIQTNIIEVIGHTIDLVPNPAHEQVKIYINPPSELKEIIITDSKGQKIVDKTLNNRWITDLYELNLSNIKPGIYILSVITGNGKLQRKLIVN